MSDRTLTEAELEGWERDGFVHLPGFVAGAEFDAFVAAVDDIAGRADGERQLLQHYELVDDHAQICRSEHLIEGYPVLRDLLTTGPLPAVAGELFGEPASLYKEKVNYKLAGGAGFSPHQDAPAYPFIDTHATCMVALDAATVHNGCLELVAGHHAEVLPMDERSCIHPQVVARLRWRPLPVEPGDVLWFHSRTPHRSGPNRSRRHRRALFCTYAAASTGDLRDAYYAEKLARFADDVGAVSAARGTTRVSLIDDFEGVAPSPSHLSRISTPTPT